MKIINHDKVYIGTEIKETKMEIILDPKDKLDNIIYYLLCAQEKKNQNEIMAHDARVDSALSKLIEFVKKDDNEKAN